MNKPTAIGLRVFMAIMLATLSSSAAGTDTWDGNTDANWSTAGNWTTVGGSTPPANGDSLVFGAAGTAGTSLNNDISGLLVLNFDINSGASAFTFGGNAITLRGALTSAASVNETFSGGLTIAPSVFAAIKNTGSGTLDLGALTRTAGSGGSVNFTPTGTIHTTTANNNGILGGWATVGNAGTSGASGDWAAVDGSGNIITYADYTAITGAMGSSDYAAQNWKVNNAAGALTASATVNSLVLATDFSISSGATMTLGSGGLILSGISRWLKNNGNGDTVGSAQLTSGLGSGELFVDVPSATSDANNWRIWPKIVDNGATPVILVKNGPGYVRLEAANSYTGGTILNAGTVFLSNGSGGSGGSGRLGTGTVTFNGGTLNLNAGTLANDFVIPAGSSVVIDNAGGNGTLNGNFTGAGTLTLQNSIGSGLSESVNGSWSGFTGTLNYNGSASANNFNFFAPASMDLSSATVNFSNSGNRSGSSFRTSGTTRLGSLAGFGYLDVAGAVEIGNLNTSTSYTGFIRDNGSAGAVTKVGNGTLTLSGANTYTGGTIVNAGALNLGLGGGAGPIRGTLTINPGATVNTTVNDALGYNSDFSRLSTVNIYGGTLNNSISGNQGYRTSVNLMGGSLTSSGGGSYNFTSGFGISSLATNTGSLISAPILLRDTANLTFNVAAGTVSSGIDLSISGIISQQFSGSQITKTGTGTLLLSAANTYTGTTTVNAGKLLVNNATGSGTGSGSVNVNNANSTLGGTGTISGAITLNAGTIIAPGESGTAGSILTCSGGITFVGGANAVFDLSSSAASGNDQVVVTGTLTIGSADTLTINPITVSTLDTADYTLFTATAVAGTGTPTLAWGSSTPANAASYSLVKNAGSLVLHYTAPGAPPTVGLTEFSPGGTVNVGTMVTASAAVSSTGTGLSYQWQSSPDGSTWSDIGGATSATYSVATGSTGMTYYRLIATDSLGTGTGGGAALTVRTPVNLTWLLSPANSIWDHSSANWSGASSVFADGDSVTFDNAGSGGTVTLTETVVPGAVTFSNASYTLVASGGNIAGATTLTKSGTGTLTLLGPNTYSGGTTLNNGTLDVASSSTALGSGSLTLAGGTLAGHGVTITNNVLAPNGSTATVQLSGGGNVDLIGNLTGGGTINAQYGGGSGICSINLGGDNSGFTGTFTAANHGSVRYSFTSASSGSANALWVLNNWEPGNNSGISFSLGTGTLKFGALSGNGGMRGTATLNIGGLNADATWSGNISANNGTIHVVKSGTGTQTFSANNTYNGTTTVSNGTLLVNGSLAAGSAVTVAGGTLGGSGTIGGAVTVTAGGTLAPGSSIGTLTLGAAPTLNGTLAMEVAKTSGVTTADKVVLTSGTFACGGTLTVTKTGSDALAAGDTFNLITNLANPTGFSGWFSSISLPSLPVGGAGLSWDTNKLATTGVLDVYPFTTTPLEIVMLSNQVATISATKMVKHVTASRGTVGTIAAVSVSTPAHGVASVSSGALTYTPTTDYTGSDSFIVTFLDGHGWQTMVVSVTVNAINAGSQLSFQNVGGYAQITTSGKPNTLYDVQAQTTDDDVTTPWTTIDTVTSAANGVILWTDDELMTAHQMRIYRIAQP